MSQAVIKKWFAIALSPAVVRRSAGYALVVGTLLILINHGACIMDEVYSVECFLQSILSAAVPYLVVTFSTVQATLASESGRAG